MYLLWQKHKPHRHRGHSSWIYDWVLTKSDLKEHTYNIISVAIEVHEQLGPGLLESVYHRCMLHEMKLRNYVFTSELLVPVEYKGLTLDTQLRCDFLFANCMVVELKSVNAMTPIFEAQLLTYMKLLQVPKGILINFNVTNIFREGQKTLVNDLFRHLPD